MDALSATTAALIADAKRAASPGFIGHAPDRIDSLIVDPLAPENDRQFAPSASALSVAIDGPGMFVFQDGSNRVYGRMGEFRIDSDGFLVDSAGRKVLGVPASGERHHITDRTLVPITIRAAGGFAKPFVAYQIDPSGMLSGSYGQPQGATGGAPIARLALAVFSAPQRLRPVTDTTLAQSAESGKPTLFFPGDPNVGALRSHSLETGLVDLRGDLAALWRVSRQADLSVACALADDACRSAAADLVK